VGCADGDDVGDAVVLDDDVHGTDWCCSGSVDDGNATDDEAVVGATSVFWGAVRGWIWPPLSLGLLRAGGEQ
jgi:hypothetical protein